MYMALLKERQPIGMSIKIKVQNNSGCNYQNKKEDECTGSQLKFI